MQTDQPGHFGVTLPIIYTIYIILYRERERERERESERERERESLGEVK